MLQLPISRCRNTGRRTGKQYEFTRQCVGQVLFLVKATPAKEHHMSLQSLGLPTEALRFAIVRPYNTEKVQHALKLSEEDKHTWMKEVKEACIAARAAARPSDFDRMLRTVEAHSQVLSTPKEGGAFTLYHRWGAERGVLRQLAVPVSTKSDEWFHHQRGPVSCEPVVRIEHRLSGMRIADPSRQASSALTKAAATLMYFVNTYSRTGSGLFM